MIKNCEVCDKEFKTYPSRIKMGSGKYCSKECCLKETNKVLEANGKGTRFKKGEMENEKHPNWKGDDASYSAVHHWVKRKLGKPKECILCNSKENVQWANKSHKYKRQLNDWIPLCYHCHREYDKGHWGSIRKKYGKRN